MQANNKITGEVIKLKKAGDYTYYNVFENGITAKNEIFFVEKITEKRNIDYIPEIPMSENQLCEFSSYQKIIENEPGFEIDFDEKNWIFENGSTGKKTIIRIAIHNSLIAANIDSETPFGQLLQQFVFLKNFSKVGNNFTVIYLEELLEEHRNILLDNDVLIEERL